MQRRGDCFCETYKVDGLYHQTDLFGRTAENIDQFPVEKNLDKFPEGKKATFESFQQRWPPNGTGGLAPDYKVVMSSWRRRRMMKGMKIHSSNDNIRFGTVMQVWG